MLRYLSSFFTTPSPPPPPPVDDLPPAKVAIIGAGIGGCFAAKFLRENGGKDLDIHVFAKKGSKIGGRAEVCHFDQHVYEAGAVVFHAKNKYMNDAAKEYGIPIRKELISIPYGIFDGTTMFHPSLNKVVHFVQLLWRYGFSIFRMRHFVNTFLKNIHSLYGRQASGETFTEVEDMLAAMGGEEMVKLTQVSISNYMINNLRLSERLTYELVTSSVRLFYAQGSSASAITAGVALSPFVNGNMYKVIGGNHKVAERLLEASGSSLIMENVVCVAKSKQGASVKYAIVTGDGKTHEDYDAVIIAHPLNVSIIEFKNLEKNIYTKEAKVPYQPTAVTFCKGKINQSYFAGKTDVHNFPLFILSKDMPSPHLDFGCIEAEVPSNVELQETHKFQLPLRDDPIRVWKVYSQEPLNKDQFEALFPGIDPEDTVCYNWLDAYPKYSPPCKFPSFVLDEGLFYINALEKAISFMESTAISAKNAALLARNYLVHTE